MLRVFEFPRRPCPHFSWQLAAVFRTSLDSDTDCDRQSVGANGVILQLCHGPALLFLSHLLSLRVALAIWAAQPRLLVLTMMTVMV
jgi:hypothetical protein